MTSFPLLLVFSLWQTPVQTPAIQSVQETEWVSLSYGRTYGRAGPGRDYPIRWEYHRKNLPLQLLRRASEWSRVQDVDGDITWMHNSLLSDTRPAAIVISTEPIPLYALGTKKQKTLARLAPGVVLRIENCHGKWCTVRIKDKKGRVQASGLWGAIKTQVTPTP